MEIRSHGMRVGRSRRALEAGSDKYDFTVVCFLFEDVSLKLSHKKMMQQMSWGFRDRVIRW